MSKIIFCLSVCLLPLYAMNLGIEPSFGVRFLNFPELSGLEKENDSSYKALSDSILLRSPKASFQKVGFQRTKMSLPLGLNLWYQQNPYLRIYMGTEWTSYSDQALWIQEGQSQAWDYSLRVLNLNAGAAFFIPKSILSMDSVQNLRLEVQRLWTPYATWNWGSQSARAEQNLWGSGWDFALAYDFTQSKYFSSGIKIGYRDLSLSSRKNLAEFLPKSKLKGSVAYDLGGLFVSLNLSFGKGAEVVAPPKNDSLSRDSLTQNPLSKSDTTQISTKNTDFLNNK